MAGDFQKLVQVVINLLMNAGQALENKGQSITVSTSANRHKNIVTIEVTDTGPGVAKDLLEKIIDPFSPRAGMTGDRSGTVHLRKIISEMLGVLELTSEPGQGLCARIVLPCTEK